MRYACPDCGEDRFRCRRQDPASVRKHPSRDTAMPVTADPETSCDLCFVQLHTFELGSLHSVASFKLSLRVFYSSLSAHDPEHHQYTHTVKYSILCCERRSARCIAMDRLAQSTSGQLTSVQDLPPSLTCGPAYQRPMAGRQRNCTTDTSITIR